MSEVFGVLFYLLSYALVIGALVFWIWILVDCIRNESSEGNDKIIWVLVILLVGPIGGVLYCVVRRPERIRQVGR